MRYIMFLLCLLMLVLSAEMIKRKKINSGGKKVGKSS